MKIKKVGKLLKKLNNLFDNIKEEGSISKIEKDLFLAYIKEIYEASIEDGGGSKSNAIIAEKPVKESAPAAISHKAPPTLSDIPTDEPASETNMEVAEQAPTPVHEEELDERELRKRRREEERRKREEERRLRNEQRQSKRQETTPTVTPPEPVSEPVSEPVAENLSPVQEHQEVEAVVPEPSNGTAPVVETQIDVLENIKETVEPESPEPAIPVVEAPPVTAPVADPVSVPQFSEEMIAIFEETAITEVSDRLSMTPIADLTKAMGINEKIFTVRELFNKDQDQFMKTMTHLNSCVNFEEAKQYLMHGVANENDWDDPTKSKKAINFIKLVQRRYRK